MKIAHSATLSIDIYKQYVHGWIFMQYKIQLQ